MFYSTTHSTHYIYGYISSDMVENHSDSRVLGLFFVFFGGRGGFVVVLGLIAPSWWIH